MIRVVEEVLGRMRIRVLNDEIQMSLRSTKQESRRALAAAVQTGASSSSSSSSGAAAPKGKTARVAAAAPSEPAEGGPLLVSEVQDPLITLSTTELQERKRALEEERLVLRDMLKAAREQERGKERDVVLGVGKDFEAAHEYQAGVDAAAAAVEAGGQPSGAEGAAAGLQPQGPHEFELITRTQKLARALHVVRVLEVSIDTPYEMISDMVTYPEWMPWCATGKMIGQKGENEYEAEVGFGFDTGTFLGTLGDSVRYTVHIEPPFGSEMAERRARVLADNRGFAYGERLAYDWRFRQVGESRTEVSLNMIFTAKTVLYLPVWDSMQKMVMGGMMQAFIQRAAKLDMERRAPHAAPAKLETG